MMVTQKLIAHKGKGDSRNHPSLLHHTGRELDVDIFDREFAGDEAREERISSHSQLFILKRENSLRLKL